MSVVRGVLLLVVLVGCGQPRRSGATPELCDAIAIASKTASDLGELGTTQYISADNAMTLWGRWRRNEVSAEADGSGLYSSAGTRARGYRDAALALCQSARALHWSIGEMAAPIDDPEVREGRSHTADFKCKLQPSAISPDERERKVARDEWITQVQYARTLEDAIVDACYKHSGGSRRSFITPSLLLPTE